MNRRGEAPRELSWASAVIGIAGVLVFVGQERAAKKIQEAREANANYHREIDFENDSLRTRTERQERKIAELNYELDGPWEEDVDGGKTETPASGKTALEEAVDPASRTPAEEG